MVCYRCCRFFRYHREDGNVLIKLVLGCLDGIYGVILLEVKRWREILLL
jgi:hypothetical protein